MRRQFRIGNEFQDRRRQCLSIPRFNEQTVLAMANNFWNIAHFRSDHGSSAGESLTQNNWRGFGAQRHNHDHVACGVNIRRVPAITSHDDFVGKSGAIDCVPHIDAALQNPGALADDDETRIGTFLQDQRGRFDQLELTFIRTNHPHVADQRGRVAETDFMAEFCPVARRLELFQIDS